ncbi:MAG: aminotransferase class V-fold PLP-dependent enzyme [Planctomycetota bacterium]
MPRIYLDNAATSWPKPAVVYDAIDRYQREVGAAAGRGAYDSAGEAQRVVTRVRGGVARLLGVSDPNRIIFTASGTESLNHAIFGLVFPGDHVVTTVFEHNSVLRPLAMLRDTAGVKVDYASCNESGVVDPQAIADLIRPDTKLVAVTSASNVTGALQDIAAIGAICRERNVPLLVDAAQSLGHHRLDVVAAGVSLLAAPGHKGLLGPLGVGVLYVAPGVEERLRPLQYGGTGLSSDQETPPTNLPEGYEAGNLNVPALAGLAAGIDWLVDSHSSDQSGEATGQLLKGLTGIVGVQVHGPAAAERRMPVVSFAVEGYDPQEVAAILATAGIECRAGLHCSPRMHTALGTDKRGGTVRLSPGRTTTTDEIATTLELVRQLAAAG